MKKSRFLRGLPQRFEFVLLEGTQIHARSHIFRHARKYETDGDVVDGHFSLKRCKNGSSCWDFCISVTRTSTKSTRLLLPLRILWQEPSFHLFSSDVLSLKRVFTALKCRKRRRRGCSRVPPRQLLPIARLILFIRYKWCLISTSSLETRFQEAGCRVRDMEGEQFKSRFTLNYRDYTQLTPNDVTSRLKFNYQIIRDCSWVRK